MLKKSAVTSLVVICVTILIGLWIVRDSLCDISYQSGSTIITATLAYESR
ncbi:Hok/Gef family protein [Aliivibrio fischeri]|uniref:Hok/Gef family protein n=1 Tax=Aliivibrio fischeri TaxID=668 RepID=A0A844P7X1_ALIFS|nr:Hok/Gef family protein [Aliivibrio fischeri]MUK51227.1 Hok/Gef family protein [Aliivibrio fischeri]